jgi:hypothetical protein
MPPVMIIGKNNIRSAGRGAVFFFQKTTKSCSQTGAVILSVHQISSSGECPPM